MENENLTLLAGGVTAPQGFMAGGAAAGIKAGGALDMAVLYSDCDLKAAGTFTTNVVKAAPVVWDSEKVKGGQSVRAVVVNSGVANACTGRQGMEYCQRTAEAAAAAFDIPPDSVLLASTGVIGRQLPIEKMEAGVAALKDAAGEGLEDGNSFAHAIMTTDTRDKQAAVLVKFKDGATCTVGGCCKGSGMIHPNMCTMLAFITTDAKISRELLQKALSEVVPDTFNMVSVDGDTSTNDTCLLLSSGLAGNAPIEEEGEDYEAFKAGVYTVLESLAKQMARDGEGATRLFEVHVIGAQNKADAKTIARSVVSSSLTKAALYGRDANWGRILCAMGYSGAKFVPEKVDLYFISDRGRLQILANGIDTGYSEEKATEILSSDAVTCIADLHEGDAEATAWGCDLTHEYVDINADYRS